MSNEMEVARRDEISLGEATILCDLDTESSSSVPKEYKIEIQK